MAFGGFPEEGFTFLRELARHNDRAWLEGRREPWEARIVPAMLDWLAELQARLHDVMPALVLVPRQGGSLYRLARDTRFGKDKRPYHAYAAALLWEGGERHDCPGLYLRVSPDEVIFGGGLWIFEEARLDRYRKLLQSSESAERLERALQSGKAAGLAVEGEQLPRPPRPFNAEHPRVELSRYQGLALGLHQKPGPWLFTREALARSEEFARAYAPLHAWMRDELCSTRPLPTPRLPTGEE